MRIGSGLFLLGILTLVQFRELPSLYFVTFLLPLAILSARIKVLRYLVWYTAGFVWLLITSHMLLAQKLEPDLEWEEVTVQGHVVSLPSVSGLYIQFDLAVTHLIALDGISRPGPGKVRLNWYRPYPDLMPGDRLDIVVKLKQPHGFMNPGGFDYESWLFQQRIRATGYVRKNNADISVRDRRFTFHSIRYYLRAQLDMILAETPGNRLIPALTIGDRSRMDNRQWQVLATTGTSHLLAISGLHVGLVAGFVFFLSRSLWPLWYRGACFVPAQKVAAAIAMVAAAGYAMLAGFTIPTQRAMVMTGVVLLVSIMNRKTVTGDVYALALLAVLIMDPLAVLSAGFWLSFAAVLVILLSLNIRLGKPDDKHRLNLFLQWSRVQLYIYLGLIPLLVIWFNQVPVLSIFANSLAIPWVSLICIPLLMVGVPVFFIHAPAGEVILNAGGNALGILWYFLEYLAGVDSSLIFLQQPSRAALLIAFVGMGILFLPAGMPGRWLGIILLLPLFFPRADLLGKGEFEVTVLDVGQGLASVVKTRNHLLLYDTGPGFSTGFNAGWAVIVPFLKNSGYRNVDIIIVSHGDSDHIGGLADILKAIKVEKVLISEPDKTDFANTERCIAGQEWHWDDIHFEILSPYIEDKLGGNNGSCVLRIDNGNYSILMSGDIESRAEQLLIRKNPDALDVNLLVAPHHGSATSSTPEFVRLTSPDIVIFPTGYLNRYRFPRKNVVDRYHDFGSETLNTAHDGAISIQFRNNKTGIVRQREKSLRYWHNNTLTRN